MSAIFFSLTRFRIVLFIATNRTVFILFFNVKVTLIEIAKKARTKLIIKKEQKTKGMKLVIHI